MPKQLSGALYYLSVDARYYYFYFWTILLSVLLLSVLVDLIFTETYVNFTMSVPLYVFSAIVGQLFVKRSVPYLIKMGSTRKNVFLSFGIHFFILAIVNALLANTIQTIISFVYRLTGRDITGSITISDETNHFTITHIAEFIQDTWMTRVIIDTSLMFFMLSASFLLGLIFYRYGLVGGISFIGAALFLLVIGFSKGWVLELVFNIIQNFSISFFYQLLGIGLFIYLLSFLLLRKATVK